MKYSREFRLLDMYHRLSHGFSVCKSDESYRYGVSERSIQRDIDAIRNFLSDRAVIYGSDNRCIRYCHKKKTYQMIEDYQDRSVNKVLFASLS